MKLERCIIQNNAISDLDLLKMENEFLRDELKFQEAEQSIELIQTIIHCIKEEKEVSPSLEIMFGENWNDKNTALLELESALEGFLKDTFNTATSAVKSNAVLMLINKRLDTLEEILKKKDPQEKVELDMYFHGFHDAMKHIFEALHELGELFKANKKEEACQFFIKVMDELSSPKLKEKIQRHGGSISTAVTVDELYNFIQKARQDISTPIFERLNSEKETVIKFVKENEDLVKKYNISEGTVNRVYDTFVRVILMGWSRMIQKAIVTLNSTESLDNLTDGARIFRGKTNGKELVIDGEHFSLYNPVFNPNGTTMRDMHLREYFAKKYNTDVFYIGIKLERIYPYYEEDGTIINEDGTRDITHCKNGASLT